MIKRVNIDLIRLDGGTQARESTNPETVQEYAAAMLEGAEFPPVVLFFDGQVYWLGDGFHRVSATRHAGKKTIQADVSEGGFRDALLVAVGANSNHGLPRTNKDKRRAVTRMLDDPEFSQWSDREIARQCCVSQPFVSQIRSERVITVITTKSDKNTQEESNNHIHNEEEGAGPAIETKTRVPAESGTAAPVSQTTNDNREPGGSKPSAPAPASEDVAALNARIADLESENAELKEHVRELIKFNDEAKEELEAARRVLDAEDLLAGFNKEVKRNQELARVVQSRNNGLMVENHDLAGRLKSALRKAEKLEKRIKGVEGQGAGSEPEPPTEEDEYNAAFEGVS